MPQKLEGSHQKLHLALPTRKQNQVHKHTNTSLTEVVGDTKDCENPACFLGTLEGVSRHVPKVEQLTIRVFNLEFRWF